MRSRALGVKVEHDAGTDLLALHDRGLGEAQVQRVGLALDASEQIAGDAGFKRLDGR
jgi:hypothetical protein